MESLKRESKESCKRCGSAAAHDGKGSAFPSKVLRTLSVLRFRIEAQPQKN
jgi:hypothetical protein